jgi:hypothetical protein
MLGVFLRRDNGEHPAKAPLGRRASEVPARLLIVHALSPAAEKIFIMASRAFQRKPRHSRSIW